MTAIRHNGKMALECFIEDILEMGLFPVNPVSTLQSLLNPVYYLAMERETRQRRAIRHVIEEAGRPLSPHEVLKGAQVYPRLGIATVYRTLKGQTGPKDCLHQCGNKRLCRLVVTPSISRLGSHTLEAAFCLNVA